MMPQRHSLIVIVSLCLMSAIAAFAQAPGSRYALVIGNGNYADFGRLANPVNDATDIAAALKGLGFTVRLLTDASRKQMNQGLGDFHDQLAQDSSSVGFFWYAGHGVQSKGENYLIPVGTDIKREADLEDEAVSARKIAGILDDARNRMNVVVLDACRNNPIPSLGRSGTRGLTVTSAVPAESVIMYSTGAGQVAADGSGRNSPFAQAFLKYIGHGGDITTTIKAVTAETKRLTGGAQVPYVYSSLTLDFSFNAGAAAPAPTITIARAYGSLEVSAATAGALYLDGAKLGDLPASAKASLSDIEAGDRSLELRYADGQVEKSTVTIASSKVAHVAFSYKRSSARASATPSGFVLVPTGTFTTGSPANEVGRDGNEIRRVVNLTGFAMSATDVTVGEYRAFVKATGYRTGAEIDGKAWGLNKAGEWGYWPGITWQNTGFAQSDQSPVVCLGWYDTIIYCNWRSQAEGRKPVYAYNAERDFQKWPSGWTAKYHNDISCDFSADGYRLPTSAEWEYAAKGGPASSSLTVNAVYAGSKNLDDVAWYYDNSGSASHPVGQKKPNALGLYDMSGNVNQWCWDWVGKYPEGDLRDPSGALSGVFRVFRGGSWFNIPQYLRSAAYSGHDPFNYTAERGFRLVCSRAATSAD